MGNDAHVLTRREAEAGLFEGKRPLLGRLDVELTERCNLDCVHCYINRPAGDEEAGRREMSTEQVKAVLREAADLGCLTVRFTGGEPLLREDFSELYLHARGLGLRVLLFTNATLITPEVADLLARTPPLEKVEVTVYGMSPKTYEAVTGVRGAHRAAMRGIALLLERGVPLVVKGAWLAASGHEVRDFEEWAATIPWMDHPPSYAMFFDLRARRDREEKGRRIEELRPSPEAGVAALTRDGERYRKTMAEFCGRFMGPPGKELFGCGAGVGGGCVDAYGRMQACMLLRHPDTVYELAPPPSDRPGLHEALSGFFPRMRQMRAEDPEYLARCARCFLKGLCEQCPAKSWMEHGRLDTPVEYLCRVAHARARDLGLLGEDEHGWEVTDGGERAARLGRHER